MAVTPRPKVAARRVAANFILVVAVEVGCCGRN